MFKVSTNREVMIDKGDDSGKFPIFINKGTPTKPIRYELTPKNVTLATTSTTIRQMSVNIPLFKETFSEDGLYTFCYSSAGWKYLDNPIDLATIGIKYVGRPEVDDTIIARVSSYEEEVYFYVFRIHDSEEHYLFKKTFTRNGQITTECRHKQPRVTTDLTPINDEGDFLLQIDSEDTENLIPDEYRYLVKAKLYNATTFQYEISTIIDAHPFYVFDPANQRVDMSEQATLADLDRVAVDLPEDTYVISVNGQSGVVVLNHADVGADQEGSATQALTTAKAYTDSTVQSTITNVVTPQINRLDGRIDSLDYDLLIPSGNRINRLTQTNGLVSATITALQESDIPGLSARLNAIESNASIETRERTAADTALNTRIDNLDYSKTISAGKVPDVISQENGLLNVTERTLNQSDVDGLVTRLVNIEDKATAEEAARTAADAALNTRIDNLDYVDTAIEHLFVTEVDEVNGVISVTRAQPTQADVDGLVPRLTNIETAATTETTNRTSADVILQEQIDALEAKTDVVDVVSCYDRGEDTSKSDIVHYDTTKLHNNDIVKVLQDETKNNSITYYRWVITSTPGTWNYIGALGPFYTKAETDTHITTAKTEVQTNLDTHTSNKNNPHEVTKTQVGLSNVPNVTTNNQTPTYTEAETLTNISSGEVLSTAFGKIKKAITELISHINNKSNPHEVTLPQLGVNATATELNYSSGVTSNIQTQINTVSESIKNSTITILKNGSTVDSFTLNQSTDKSINVSVCKSGSTDPTTSTVADSVGDFYLNTTSNVLFVCSAISGSTYTWETVKSGGYLGGWDCFTGLPRTQPASLPYIYKAGDFYRVDPATTKYLHTISYWVNDGAAVILIVSNSSTPFNHSSLLTWFDDNGYSAPWGSVEQHWYSNVTGTADAAAHCTSYQMSSVMFRPTGTTTVLPTGAGNFISDVVTAATKYKPDSSQYTGVPSTTVESDDAQIGDVYFYNGTSWSLWINHAIDAYTKAETNTLLAGKSDISHIHDDRYYTETEMDAALALKLEATSSALTTAMPVDANTLEGHPASYFQEKTSNSLSTTSKNIVGAINEVDSIALGANQALGVANYQTLVTMMNGATAAAYRVGQNIYVQTLNVPDVWVYSVESSSVPYTYTTDEALATALDSGAVQMGYYKISKLETGKVDLTNYRTASAQDVIDATKLAGVKINGTDLVVDANKKVNIPMAVNGTGSANGTLGLVSASTNYQGILVLPSGCLATDPADSYWVSNRFNGGDQPNHKPICPSKIDEYVKAHLTDGRASAYSASEKTSAQTRIGIASETFTFTLSDGTTVTKTMKVGG